jgi:signal transduction histidine kinase/DNA-binding NtrC family response regulator
MITSFNVLLIIFIAISILLLLLVLNLKKILSNSQNEIRSILKKNISLKNQMNQLSDKNSNLLEQCDNVEKELSEINNKQKHFFLHLSHNLKDLITVIIKDLQENTKINSESLQVSINSSYRLNHLIDEVLDLQTIEKNKNKNNLTPINLVNFLNSITAKYKKMCEQKSFEFKYTINDQLFVEVEKQDIRIYVEADVSYLEKIIYHYLINAIKYSPKNTLIHLNINQSDDKVLIVVKDQGKGISEENKRKLFIPYSTMKGSKVEQSGLGLSLVKQFANQMNAKVGVESIENEGSSFYLEIPEYNLNLEIIDLLVVEDEEELRDVYNDYFKLNKNNLGNIKFASNPKEARAIIENYRVKCVFSDVIMPEENGVNFLIYVYNKFPKTKRVVITGQADDALIEKAINEAKVDMMLRKPLTPKKIGEILEKIIESSSVEDEPQSAQKEVVDLLIVDDDDDLHFAYESMFVNNKVIKTIKLAIDAQEARDLMEDYDFKCIISDALMPGEDGASYLSFACKSQPLSKRVMITGQASEDMLQKAKNEGKVDLIVYKPWKRKELVKIIEDFVISSEISGENESNTFDWQLEYNFNSNNHLNNSNFQLYSDLSGNKEIILNLNESKDLADIIHSHLVKDNYKVITVSTTKSALEAFERFSPDLLLCDIHLQKSNISDLINTLKEKNIFKGLSFLTLTSNSLEEIKIIDQLKPDNFIGKPFNDFELLNIINKTLMLKKLSSDFKNISMSSKENLKKRYISDDLSKDIKSEHLRMSIYESTIVICNIKKFTEITMDLEPSKSGKMLNEYLNIMTDVIYKLNGTIEKYNCDQIIVLFGAPINMSKEDQIKKALKCSARMQREMKDLSGLWSLEDLPPLSLRVAVHQGKVNAGEAGSETRKDFMAYGHPITTAAKIESLAQSGEILISDQIISFLNEDEFEPTDDLNVSEDGKPVKVYKYLKKY